MVRKLKSVVFLLSALFFVNSYGMEPAQNDAPLQVYFAPKDQAQMRDKLFALIDNAKHQLYIAIYWMTDKSIIEKILAAKRRNVNVLIVMDESSPDIDSIVNQFLANGIVPVIHPSKVEGEGLMHHKFILVDHAVVLTGSANFTQAALNPNAKISNFENIMIIKSAEIVPEFSETFLRMRQSIMDQCAYFVAVNDPSNLPKWMHNILPVMYQKDHHMKYVVTQMMNEYALESKIKIRSFFGIQFPLLENLLTENQLAFIRSRGFSDQELLDLSKEEDFRLISELIKQEKQGWGRQAVKGPMLEDSISDSQIALLRSKGVADEDILGLSKREASDFISELIRQEKQGFGRQVVQPNWEPATDKQRALLRNKGVSEKEIEGLSKQEATGLITELIRGRGSQSSYKRTKY